MHLGICPRCCSCSLLLVHQHSRLWSARALTWQQDPRHPGGCECAEECLGRAPALVETLRFQLCDGFFLRRFIRKEKTEFEVVWY